MSDAIFLNGPFLDACRVVTPHEVKAGEPFKLDLDIGLGRTSRAEKSARHPRVPAVRVMVHRPQVPIAATSDDGGVRVARAWHSRGRNLRHG